jgi:crotonobetainyl-CoA:carnitine CoA-transferase CaiB-like acyl-CoA transferase
MSGVYKDFNRNKRSIILNLKNEEARHVLHRIAENMDVVVEGFRPGTVQRLGADYLTLASMNPRLIYCAMSGYGQEGPYRDVPGHDINYVAMGGALSMFGEPPPVIPNFIGDYAGATLHAIIGILLALMAREKTGRGQYVDIAYVDGVISLMTQFASAYFATGDTTGEGYRRMNLANPGYGAYKTKDGKYITLGCVEPWFWQNLCHALERESFIPQYGEWGEEEEMRRSFSDVFLTKTRDEWFDMLKGMNIPVGKVYRIDELFTDPQVLQRRMLVEIEGSGGEKQPQVGIPIKLTDTPGRIRSPAPVPGQHTEQVLFELGFTKDQIQTLCEKGAVFPTIV